MLYSREGLVMMWPVVDRLLKTCGWPVVKNQWSVCLWRRTTAWLVVKNQWSVCLWRRTTAWLVVKNQWSVCLWRRTTAWLVVKNQWSVCLENDHCMSVYEPCCILDNEVCRCSKSMYSREGNTVDRAYSQTMLQSGEGNSSCIFTDHVALEERGTHSSRTFTNPTVERRHSWCIFTSRVVF